MYLLQNIFSCFVACQIRIPAFSFSKQLKYFIFFFIYSHFLVHNYHLNPCFS